MLGKAIKRTKISLVSCGTKISYYYQEIFGPVEERENAFAFEDTKLLEMARRHLATYERREAALMVRNKKELIFTAQAGRPFTKVYEGTLKILQNLFAEIEHKLNRDLTQVEKALLEWEIYNESEARIINLVMKEIFKIKLNPVETYLMVKKLKRYFKRGEKIWVKDLEDIFGPIRVKRAELYKYVG